ncbi:MAG: hypothetical protein ACK56I_06520, partial [bacterium]
VSPQVALAALDLLVSRAQALGQVHIGQRSADDQRHQDVAVGVLDLVLDTPVQGRQQLAQLLVGLDGLGHRRAARDDVPVLGPSDRVQLQLAPAHGIPKPTVNTLPTARQTVCRSGCVVRKRPSEDESHPVTNPGSAGHLSV